MIVNNTVAISPKDSCYYDCYIGEIDHEKLLLEYSKGEMLLEEEPVRGIACALAFINIYYNLMNKDEQEKWIKTGELFLEKTKDFSSFANERLVAWISDFNNRWSNILKQSSSNLK